MICTGCPLTRERNIFTIKSVRARFRESVRLWDCLYTEFDWEEKKCPLVKLSALRVPLSGELTVVMATVVDAHSVSGSIIFLNTYACNQSHDYLVEKYSRSMNL